MDDYNKLLHETSTKPANFWKVIKEVYPTKLNVAGNSTSFIIAGKLTKNKSEITNGFCNSFSTVANKIKTKASPLMNCVWRYQTVVKKRPAVNFSFSQVTVQDINKATGLDNIPPSYLKDMADVISQPLTHVINLSFYTSVIPNDFKIGKIRPIYKSESTNNVDNYRPITILSTPSKILEKCVHAQLMSYLEKNDLLTNSQFGFHGNRSTESAVTFFTDHIRKKMDKGEYTGAVYIDLSKAFDTISHASIPTKLPEFGIDDTPKEWITNYLFNRTKRVVYDGILSDAEPVFCGVPQGSILGSLLFLLHFNGSTKTIKRCKIVKYAEDFISHKNIGVTGLALSRERSLART